MQMRQRGAAARCKKCEELWSQAENDALRDDGTLVMRQFRISSLLTIST